VFRACLDPGLHAATMAAHRERVVAGPRGRPLEAGDTVAFEDRHFGLRLRLTARVTAAETPRWFADEQVAGPFRRWRHVHRFAPDGAGGTVMTDEVDFAAPLGPLGRIAEAVFLRRYMERLIRSRSSHLPALLADGDGGPRPRPGRSRGGRPPHPYRAAERRPGVRRPWPPFPGRRTARPPRGRAGPGRRGGVRRR